MMSNQPETFTCHKCGHSWEKGQSGSHNCADLLIKKVDQQADRIAKLEQQLNASIDRESGSDIAADMAMNSVDELQTRTIQQAARITELEAENTELRKPFGQAPFFLYDPEDGFSEFKTLTERDEAADGFIQEYLGDGWDESVTNIVSGVITARTHQVDLTSRPDDLDEEGCDKEGRFWSDDWDHMCNYKLIPVTERSENITRFENADKATAVMSFVNMMIGAHECGFVDGNPTLAEIHQVARHHIKGNYGIDHPNITEEWGQDVAELCGIKPQESEPGSA